MQTFFFYYMYEFAGNLEGMLHKGTYKKNTEYAQAWSEGTIIQIR